MDQRKERTWENIRKGALKGEKGEIKIEEK